MTLPQDVFELIVSELVNTSRKDPSFRQTFAARAQDLASLCMVCSELRSAVIATGWPMLEAEAIEMEKTYVHNMSRHAETLMVLVSSPSASVDLSMKMLQSVAQDLSVAPLYGTKGQLVHRILVDGLGLPKGRPIIHSKCPFVVLQLNKERKWRETSTIKVRICHETSQRRGVLSVAVVSKVLARRFSGVDGPSMYRARGDALVTEDAVRRRTVPPWMRVHFEKHCECGNAFSNACVRKQCSVCCRDPACVRHTSPSVRPLE